VASRKVHLDEGQRELRRRQALAAYAGNLDEVFASLEAEDFEDRSLESALALILDIEPEHCR
jgi:hypothetical protein